MTNDRTAVITGSTKGWGLAVAEGLALDGVKVLVNGRNDDVAAVVSEIRSKGGTAEGAQYATDRTDGINRLMDQALDTFGHVDIWVNSLGVQRPEPLLTLNLENWNEIIRIQLTSYFLGTQRAAQEMVKAAR
ncbi:MAG: SDR family NAD(P)-dependent oxidoreductase, partial [Acidimicrobiales bacterium]